MIHRRGNSLWRPIEFVPTADVCVTISCIFFNASYIFFVYTDHRDDESKNDGVSRKSATELSNRKKSSVSNGKSNFKLYALFLEITIFSNLCYLFIVKSHLASLNEIRIIIITADIRSKILVLLRKTYCL